MLNKILWNNIFLPAACKEQLVIEYSRPPMSKSGGNIFYKIRNQLLSTEIKNLIKTNKEIRHSWLSYPSIFLLLLDKHMVVEKLTKLFQWGLNKQIKNENGFNLTQMTLFFYSKNIISFEQAQNILNCLLSQGVSLLNKNNSISCYEKGESLHELLMNKENKEFIDLEHPLINNRDLIQNVIKWSDEKMMKFILNHSEVKPEEKALLDYLGLKTSIHQLYEQEYILGKQSKIESLHKNIINIVDRGYIFFKQNHIYHSLRYLFSLDYVDNILSHRALLSCYEQFSRLNMIGRKTLSAQLISRKKETVIFNLLSHGLNLNWSIKNKEGQENILALEVLYSMPMIKMILSSENFNLCITNHKGENILHLLGDLPLSDREILYLLNKKINTLNDFKKQLFLNQPNEKGLSPLLKSIYQQEEVVIQYLLDQGIKNDDELEGRELEMRSGLAFLDECLLPVTRGEKENTWIKIDEVSEQYWNELSKKWNSEKLYLHLEQEMWTNSTIEKCVKI